MRYKDLDKVYRRQLHQAWMDGITAKDAFHKVFDGPNPHCALSTVQKKFNWFNRASKDERSATKEKTEKEIEKYWKGGVYNDITFNKLSNDVVKVTINIFLAAKE